MRVLSLGWEDPLEQEMATHFSILAWTLQWTGEPGGLQFMGLQLKLQYFGHLMQNTDSFEETLMLGKIEGRRRRGCQRMRQLDGITDEMDIRGFLVLLHFLP